MASCSPEQPAGSPSLRAVAALGRLLATAHDAGWAGADVVCCLPPVAAAVLHLAHADEAAAVWAAAGMLEHHGPMPRGLSVHVPTWTACNANATVDPTGTTVSGRDGNALGAGWFTSPGEHFFAVRVADIGRGNIPDCGTMFVGIVDDRMVSDFFSCYACVHISCAVLKLWSGEVFWKCYEGESGYVPIRIRALAPVKESERVIGVRLTVPPSGGCSGVQFFLDGVAGPAGVPLTTAKLMRPVALCCTEGGSLCSVVAASTGLQAMWRYDPWLDGA